MPWLQSCYNMMKGLQGNDIDEITLDGTTYIDWFEDPDVGIAERILAVQDSDGKWYADKWGGSVLATAWALLTLEKLAPPPPVNVDVVLEEEVCDHAGYTVTVNYTVENANVTGTVKVYNGGSLHDTIALEDIDPNTDIFTGDGSKEYHFASADAGTYTWSAEIDVTVAATGGASSQADDSEVITVIETPDVGDIPDQSTPFTSFDLDDYLALGSSASSWSVSGVSGDWSVTIGAGNVVTIAGTGVTGEPTDPLSIPVTFTASNGSESQCSDSDTATFSLNQPPVAVCADREVEAGAGCEAAADVNDGSYDPDEGDAITIAYSDEGPYSLGTTAVTITVTDSHGASDTCTANVLVVDTSDPVLHGTPADVTVQCGSDVPPVADNVTATDNCPVTVSYSEDITEGTCVNKYTLTRTWTATDSSNNSVSHTQTITVNDNTAPVFDQALPGDRTVECDAVPDAAVLTATDNCDGPVDVVYSQVRADGDCSSNYTLTRTWTTTDVCGNVASHIQTINVQDTTPPILTVPQDDGIYPSDAPITYTIQSSDDCGEVDLELTYNCQKEKKDGSLMSKMDSCVVDISGNQVTVIDSGGVGTIITISATATDECENSTSDEFVINVLRPANEGVGNGVDGNTPGHDNNGGNDDPGFEPGNPGAKSKPKGKK